MDETIIINYKITRTGTGGYLSVSLIKPNDTDIRMSLGMLD
jgi:hypothetical protein